jgi:hypothetical protein
MASGAPSLLESEWCFQRNLLSCPYSCRIACYPLQRRLVSSGQRGFQAYFPQNLILPPLSFFNIFSFQSFLKQGTQVFSEVGTRTSNSYVCGLHHWFLWLLLKTIVSRGHYGNIRYDSNMSQELLEPVLFSFSIPQFVWSCLNGMKLEQFNTFIITCMPIIISLFKSATCCLVEYSYSKLIWVC